MRNKRVLSGGTAALAVVLCWSGLAAAADGPANATGVLDQLTVATAPDLEPMANRRAVVGLTADPVAVPTPTAAESGFALMAALITWRVARRAVRRAGFSVSGR